MGNQAIGWRTGEPLSCFSLQPLQKRSTVPHLCQPMAKTAKLTTHGMLRSANISSTPYGWEGLTGSSSGWGCIPVSEPISSIVLQNVGWENAPPIKMMSKPKHARQQAASAESLDVPESEGSRAGRAPTRASGPGRISPIQTTLDKDLSTLPQPEHCQQPSCPYLQS